MADTNGENEKDLIDEEFSDEQLDALLKQGKEVRETDEIFEEQYEKLKREVKDIKYVGSGYHTDGGVRAKIVGNSSSIFSPSFNRAPPSPNKESYKPSRLKEFGSWLWNGFKSLIKRFIGWIKQKRDEAKAKAVEERNKPSGVAGDRGKEDLKKFFQNTQDMFNLNNQRAPPRMYGNQSYNQRSNNASNNLPAYQPREPMLPKYDPAPPIKITYSQPKQPKWLKYKKPKKEKRAKEPKIGLYYSKTKEKEARKSISYSKPSSNYADPFGLTGNRQSKRSKEPKFGF